MRSIPRFYLPSARSVATLAALLALAACDREITREEARAGAPSRVDGDSPLIGVGPFLVVKINERGDMVGNGSSGPYRWTRAGGLALLSYPLGRQARVSDINNAGVAVGTIYTDTEYFSLNSFGVIWDTDGQPQLIPFPEGGLRMRVAGINDAGVVAGTLEIPDPEFSTQIRSFRWTATGGMELLLSPGPDRSLGNIAGYDEHVIGINARGEVLGSYERSCHFEGGWPLIWCNEEGDWYGAMMWTASGELRELGYGTDVIYLQDLNDSGVVVGCVGDVPVVWGPVVAAFGEHGCAYAVNNAGVVVGEEGGRAFRWTAAEGRVDLGTLGGGHSHARDVNGAGEITGWATTASGARRAFTWTDAGGMQALSLPGGATRTEGMVINDAGEIGGFAVSGSGPTATWMAARWSDTIVDYPPSAHLDGPYRGRISGRRYLYSAAGSVRSDTAGARYSWDMNADGRLEAVTSSPVFNYTYPSAGTYTVRLVMRDAEGRVDTATTSAEVLANVAPVATFTGAPPSIAEGALLTVAASVTDANQGADATELSAMRYRWEWGDGSVSTAKTSSHRYADQGSYTLRLIVTDAGGLADTVVRTLPVGNVAPTARLSAPASIREGTPFTLTASALTDAAADVAAGLQVAFNCGGGFGAYGTALTKICPARPDQGSVTVGLRVRDKDGGGSATTRDIPVANAAPQVTAQATSTTSFAAGGSLAVRGTFTDPGAGDAPWRYRIYWGDGAYTVLTPVSAGATITGSHRYARAGTYAAHITVVDKDGGFGRSAPIAVTVTP